MPDEKYLLLFCTFYLLFMSTPLQCQSILPLLTCQNNGDTFNGVRYLTGPLTTFVTDPDAIAFCKNAGGTLPTFRNLTDWENYNAYKISKGLFGNRTQLGYYNYNMNISTVSFRTANGSGCPLNFYKWNPGQPNFLAYQYCLFSEPDTGFWNDLPCSFACPVICCCNCIELCATTTTTTTSTSTTTSTTTTSTTTTTTTPIAVSNAFPLWPIWPFVIFTVAILSCCIYVGLRKQFGKNTYTSNTERIDEDPTANDKPTKNKWDLMPKRF